MILYRTTALLSRLRANINEEKKQLKLPSRLEPRCSIGCLDTDVSPARDCGSAESDNLASVASSEDDSTIGKISFPVKVSLCALLFSRTPHRMATMRIKLDSIFVDGQDKPPELRMQRTH